MNENAIFKLKCWKNKA